MTDLKRLENIKEEYKGNLTIGKLKLEVYNNISLLERMATRGDMTTASRLNWCRDNLPFLYQLYSNKEPDRTNIARDIYLIAKSIEYFVG